MFIKIPRACGIDGSVRGRDVVARGTGFLLGIISTIYVVARTELFESPDGIGWQRIASSVAFKTGGLGIPKNVHIAPVEDHLILFYSQEGERVTAVMIPLPPSRLLTR